MQKKKNETEELYGELGQAFNFTQGDLEANRAGFLSFRQKQQVKKKTVNSILQMQIMTIFFGLFASMFSWGGLTQDVVIFCIASPFILFTVIMLVLSLSIFISMRKDIRESRVEEADCQPREIAERGSATKYFLSNQKDSFTLNYSQFAQLKPIKYRVYHTQRNKDILAIEEA